MKNTKVKVHIERDYSYAEFEVLIDMETLEGFPTKEDFAEIFGSLPGKEDAPKKPVDKLEMTPDSRAEWEAKQQRRAARHAEPPATAAQRRLLEKNGEWREGMTKSQASKALDDLGY